MLRGGGRGPLGPSPPPIGCRVKGTGRRLAMHSGSCSPNGGSSRRHLRGEDYNDGGEGTDTWSRWAGRRRSRDVWVPAVTGARRQVRGARRSRCGDRGVTRAGNVGTGAALGLCGTEGSCGTGTGVCVCVTWGRGWPGTVYGCATWGQGWPGTVRVCVTWRQVCLCDLGTGLAWLCVKLGQVFVCVAWAQGCVTW